MYTLSTEKKLLEKQGGEIISLIHSIFITVEQYVHFIFVIHFLSGVMSQFTVLTMKE